MRRMSATEELARQLDPKPPDVVSNRIAAFTEIVGISWELMH